MSSRIPITSAMNEIMFAVSRTVSPCAICDFPSSKSCTSRPSKLQALAKLNLVLVELSRNTEIASPLSKIFEDILFSLILRRISATVNIECNSSSVFSQVKRKSLLYISLLFNFSSF